jgi:hypothetical protein
VKRAELVELQAGLQSVAVAALQMAQAVAAALASGDDPASSEVRTSMPEVVVGAPDVEVELPPALQLKVAVCQKCLRRFSYFGAVAPFDCGDCPGAPLGVA